MSTSTAPFRNGPCSTGPTGRSRESRTPQRPRSRPRPRGARSRPRLASRSPRLEPIPTKAVAISAAMFAVLRRLGVVLVVAALALSVGPASAWASGLSRAQARELRLYDSGLVLARPGAGPALRKAGGVKLANALPIWRVPSRQALRVLPGLIRSNLVSVVAADQPLLPMATPPPPRKGRTGGSPTSAPNGAASPGAGKPLTIIDTGVDLTHEEFASRPATTALNPQSTYGAPRGARHRRRVGRCRSSEQRRSPRRLSAGQPLRLGCEPQRGRDHCRRRHPGARRRDAASAPASSTSASARRSGTHSSTP